MTAKDYLYLGLIVLAAVVFYGHGYGAGFAAARQPLNRRRAKPVSPSVRREQDWPEILAVLPAAAPRAAGGRGPRPLHGDFGKN